MVRAGRYWARRRLYWVRKFNRDGFIRRQAAPVVFVYQLSGPVEMTIARDWVKSGSSLAGWLSPWKRS